MTTEVIQPHNTKAAATWNSGGRHYDGVSLPTEPWMAARVAEEVAKLKQLPVDEVMFRLSANACQLFDLPYA